jgi:hypothetical protein
VEDQQTPFETVDFQRRFFSYIILLICRMLKPIKILFKDFALFFRKDFHPAAYFYTLIVVALSILLIYGTDLGKLISANRVPTSNTVINNMMMFVVMYFLIAIPVIIVRGESRSISKSSFFAKGLLLMCLIGFADAFSWSDVLRLQIFTSSEQSYIFKALWRMRNVMFILPVLIALRLTVDRDVKGLYGICGGNHHVKAYLRLYVVILPILAVVSFTPDFLSYYPTYKPWNFGNVFDRPVWLNTAIFETIYISDFLMVEMIFRGALVIGMASILGRTAVLPMIVVYVTLHFGKPVMETISALFGGYFLGALAFQTRHIWGGVIIHMGIAFIIELLRFFQHYTLGIG